MQFFKWKKNHDFDPLLIVVVVVFFAVFCCLYNIGGGRRCRQTGSHERIVRRRAQIDNICTICWK
jgi:hypothetical protein